MNPSETVLVTQHQQKWEAKRPKGAPPSLSQKAANHPRWDLWEWLRENGWITEAAESHSLRVGPAVTWDAGWDPGNSEHLKVLLEYQEQYRPRFIIFTPHIRYWELNKEGRMVLGDGDALQAMIQVMENQLKNGGFFLLKAPEVGRFSGRAIISGLSWISCPRRMGRDHATRLAQPVSRRVPFRNQVSVDGPLYAEPHSPCRQLRAHS